mmetsp:Transcript_12189/g.16865  ORF Transcript_12189/g.16865 Transcript_12189/m.16865 type:complete len:248 (+) Transcript_12189:146-889(+)
MHRHRARRPSLVLIYACVVFGVLVSSLSFSGGSFAKNEGQHFQDWLFSLWRRLLGSPANEIIEVQNQTKASLPPEPVLLPNNNGHIPYWYLQYVMMNYYLPTWQPQYIQMMQAVARAENRGQRVENDYDEDTEEFDRDQEIEGGDPDHQHCQQQQQLSFSSASNNSKRRLHSTSSQSSLSPSSSSKKPSFESNSSPQKLTTTTTTTTMLPSAANGKKQEHQSPKFRFPSRKEIDDALNFHPRFEDKR